MKCVLEMRKAQSQRTIMLHCNGFQIDVTLLERNGNIAKSAAG
jgi:hypothetical protein